MATLGTSESKLLTKILTVGDSTVRILDPDDRIEFFTTGSMLMDWVFGGIPRRRVTELYGDPNAGKTTTAMQVVKRRIDEGQPCLWIDVERTFDNHWAALNGLDVHATDAKGNPLLTVVQPDNAEQALQVLINALKIPHFYVIVLDTLAKLNPAAEMEIDFSKASRVGEVANMVTRVCRVAGPYLISNPLAPAVIYVNQVRDVISSMPTPTHTPGGKAVKHEAAVRLELLSPKDVMSKGDVHLERLTIRGKVRKNKVYGWNKSLFYCHLDWSDEMGEYLLNEPAELYTVAAAIGAFDTGDGKVWKPGSTAYIAGEKIANGEAAIVATLTENYELFKALKNKVEEIIHGASRVESRGGYTEPIQEPDSGGDDPDATEPAAD